MNPDLNAPVTATQGFRTADQGLLKNQNAQASDFLGRYTGAINSQPTTSALADRIGGELGLPQLRANAQSLNNTLFQLPQTYGAATRGYDVNANQLSRIIGQKQSELAPSATLASQNQQNAESTLNTRLGYAQADESKALLPYQTEQSLMSDRFAREATSYSQDNQNELSALIAKLNSGVTMSEGEKNRANALAVSEANYQHSLSLQKQSQSANGAQNVMSVTPGGQLYNPNTGQFTTVPGGNTGGGSGTNTSYGSYLGGNDPLGLGF